MSGDAQPLLRLLANVEAHVRWDALCCMVDTGTAPPEAVALLSDLLAHPRTRTLALELAALLGPAAGEHAPLLAGIAADAQGQERHRALARNALDAVRAGLK